jgi:hypothetical protein
MVRLLTLSGLILLLAVPTASAGVREQLLRECQDGRITGDYTAKQLRDARKHIPTDIDEYSDCRDVLSRAALAGHKSTGGGGSAGGGGRAGSGGIPPGGGAVLAPADQAEKDALTDARTGAAAVTVDGERIVPGLAAETARRGLPATLLLAVMLLGICALAAALPSIRRHVRSRRASS